MLALRKSEAISLLRGLVLKSSGVQSECNRSANMNIVSGQGITRQRESASIAPLLDTTINLFARRMS
jgi:hypothetical protein